MNFNSIAKQIVAPKFQWDQGLRQTDQLVKNIERGKLSATQFFDVYRTRTNELVQHQARIARAVATPLGGGQTAITIPSADNMRGLTTATEMANRKLSVQAEIMRGLGTKVQDWGKNTQWAGRQMMVGLTVPFVIGAAAAGMYANKIDAAMVRVEKVVDEPLEGFREKALKTAKEITTTMGQTVESSLQVMGELGAAGIAGPALQEMTKLSQTLATLGDMEQQDAIKGMISMQQIYKMSTEELADAVNYLNYVEDSTPTKLKDLVDAIPIAGAQVAQLGGTLQDTTILLTAFRERGIETVEGANAIKTAMNRILSPTRQAKELFQELTGQDLEKLVKTTEGKPLETFQALSDVIMGGNLALADQQRLISKTVGIYQSSRITSLLKGLQDDNGAVAKTREISEESTAAWAARTAKSLEAITSSASGQFKIALESFKAEFQDTGNLILKIATNVIKAATKVFGFFNEMPDIFKGMSLGVLALLAIAGPIAMITGILGNLLGTGIKVSAFFRGLFGKYKSVTIEQKALQLSSGALNSKMLSQSEMTQVLIYQMDQLRGAYLETAAAAKTMTTSTGALPANSSIWDMNKYRSMTSANRMPVSFKDSVDKHNTGFSGLDSTMWSDKTNALIAKGSINMAHVAEETQKAGRFQKLFNSETLMGVGIVTGLAGMVTETGSGMSEWLNYISLGSVALGALLPIVGGIGEKIKTWGAAAALSNVGTSKIGQAASNIGSKVIAGGKKAFGALASFVTGPWGLAIGATIAGIWGITKLLNAAQVEQERRQKAIINSTETWMAVLGKTKLTWGQIKDETGKVKDDVAAIVQKMREKHPELISSIVGADDKGVEKIITGEVLKLQGQGIDKGEILKSMSALLQAAGKTKKEINDILGNIEVKFDFSGGTKDIKQFLDAQRNEVANNMRRWTIEMPVLGAHGQDTHGDRRSSEQDTSASRFSAMFMDRLAGLSETDKALFAKTQAKELDDAFQKSFEALDIEGIGKNWSTVRDEIFNWDADEGKWKTDQGAVSRAKLSKDEVKELEILIDSEQRYVQSIANRLNVDDKLVKNMSVISDILPYVGAANIKATEAQDAYNKAVEAGGKDGKKMTDEEKAKLAQLYASTFGLDAAKLATNKYAEANTNSADKVRENGKALEAFLREMKDLPGVVADFWNSTTAGEGGFVDALGGDPESQAQQLVDQVKGVYTGAMDDIYSALADQAAQQWEARLQSITDSFERRKDAIQAQIERTDKAYEAKQEAFQNRWDARLERTKEAYENRQQAIERDSEKQINAIDRQIKRIEAQEEAEQEREEARQRQFEAEKKRIERLADLANRTIDYNRALATGDLDEAARVMNNAEAVTAGWAIDDTNDRMSDKADAKSKMSKKQIDQLNASKELINKTKQAKLDALREEEQAVEKSLQRQREAQQRSMERSRDIERQRLQSRLDSLSREQRVTETTERKKQEMNRRTLEIELATLKAFVPQNEKQLAAHVARVSGAYSKYGLNLQTSGGYWGKIIGNALSNNVNRARQEMSNNARWAAFGSSVAGAIAKGAFGLNLRDFFKLITTGEPPRNWKPPGFSPVNVPNGRGPGARHGGGPVDNSPGSRNGRGNSPLGSDELPMILQKGEWVFPKSTVQLYGSENMKRLAAGQPIQQNNPGLGVGGMFGGVVAGMARGMISLAMRSMMERAAAKWGGGGGTGAAVDFAKAQDGKPYVWSGVGPGGYDCSGYMSAIANVLTGKDPHQRIFSTGMMSPGKSIGPFVPGLGSIFSIGVKHGSPGHTAGTLMGTGVESTGDHVRYGKDASLATDKQFNMHFHVPESKIVEGAAIPGGVIGEPGSDRVQQRVKAVASGYGWSHGEFWNSLYALIQKESSWNPNAANPTSSARGLFQKMTSIHGPLESTIEGQARWGLDYIRGRYGNPISAWNFHKRNNWYDSGGDLLPGFTGVMNGTNKTETVVTHNQHGALLKALDVASITYRKLDATAKQLTPVVSSSVDRAGGDIYNEYNVEINGSGLTAKELESAVMSGIDNAKAKRQKRLGERK